MQSFGNQLIQIRKKSGFETAKSFFTHLKLRGLDCNYQYYMKIEKDQSFPSSSIVNQIAKALNSELSQEVVLSYCQNQFQSFDYLFKSDSSTENLVKKNVEAASSQLQGQRELTQRQIACLNKQEENYFLFLLLTLSRGPVHIDDIKNYLGLVESINDLEQADIAVRDGDYITSTSSEFRFPISEIREINDAYANFDRWDFEFSSQFDFENLINKMMIRRISPRYLSAIRNQIDTIADFVRLSDEADQKFNNDVLHLQIKLSRGELPG